MDHVRDVQSIAQSAVWLVITVQLVIMVFIYQLTLVPNVLQIVHCVVIFLTVLSVWVDITYQERVVPNAAISVKLVSFQQVIVSAATSATISMLAPVLSAILIVRRV